MKEKVVHEYNPEIPWVQEAYQRMQPVEGEAVPVEVRITQVLDSYPDLPLSPIPKGSSHLQLKFRHFSQTLLGTSPDIDRFKEHAEFLFSPELREYYAQGADRSSDGRLLGVGAHATEMGMSGATAFVEQNPEQKNAVVDCMVGLLERRPDSRFVSATRSLAQIAATSHEEFQRQLSGGYFEDVPHDLKQMLAVECLQRMKFGKVSLSAGAAAVRAALYAPLDIENLYRLRNYGHWLNRQIEVRQQPNFRRAKGYESVDTAKIYSESYSVLRRAAAFVASHGSDNATAILSGLPEIRVDLIPARNSVIALANILTPQMNKFYFDESQQLERLDPSSDVGLLKAYDRILYVLHRELPAEDTYTTRQSHKVLTTVGGIIAGMVDLAHAGIDSRGPTSIGDIVTMFPDADPQTLQTIIEGAMSRFERKRASGQGLEVYLEFRHQARTRNSTFFDRKTPGYGFLS